MAARIQRASSIEIVSNEEERNLTAEMKHFLHVFQEATDFFLQELAIISGDRTRTRANTNPNDTEANAAGRSGNARALRKQRKCGVIHEG